MATWQQNINSGGFLAGIGGNNQNAPQASDVNATLGLIRQNNEMQRSGANNVGLQALQGLTGLAQVYQQDKQQQAQNSFNQAHAKSWSTGDTSALREFAVANPAFIEQAQKAVSGLNAEQKEQLGSLAMGANTALAQGPEAFSKFVSSNSENLRRVGADPDWMIQAGVNSPEQLSHLTTTMALGAVGPEKMFDVQDKQAQRQNDQAKLAETVRSNRAGEALQARGQDITVRGQNLSNSAQTARLNHDKYVYKQSQAQLARAGAAEDMDIVSLNSQIASTGIDPLTGKPATGSRMGQARKWLEGNNSYNDALVTGERGIEKVDALLGKDSLDGVGRIQGRLPDATTSAEGLATRNTIEELKSGAFVQNVQALRGMGALSNAEGSKLENLIARLDITQPEGVVRSQLKEIKSQYSALQKVADREAQNMGYSSSGYDTYLSERKSQRGQNKPNEIAAAPEAALQALKSNPSLAQEFQAKYGYLP